MNDREHLQALVTIGERWRSTPIVDADFVGLKNEFDQTLEKAKQYLKQPRRKVVCLCGSTRFLDAFRKYNSSETLAGNIVLSIGCVTQSNDDVFSLMTVEDRIEVKKQLDILHLRKIDASDEILVLNVGGYIGESTSKEIAYAKAKGKGIRYIEDQHEHWLRDPSKHKMQ